MSDCEGDVEVVVANDVDVPVLINSAPVVTRREKKLPLGWRNFREKRELHLKDSHPPLPESERTETIDPRFHEDVWRWIHGDNPEAEEEYARGQAHVERIQARVKARIERAWDKWRKSVAVVQAKAAAVGVPVYDKHGVEPELWEREGIVLGTGKGKGRGKGKKTTLEDQDEEGEEGREGEGEGEGEEEEEEEESDGGISLSSFSSFSYDSGEDEEGDDELIEGAVKALRRVVRAAEDEEEGGGGRGGRGEGGGGGGGDGGSRGGGRRKRQKLLLERDDTKKKKEEEEEMRGKGGKTQGSGRSKEERRKWGMARPGRGKVYEMVQELAAPLSGSPLVPLGPEGGDPVGYRLDAGLVSHTMHDLPPPPPRPKYFGKSQPRPRDRSKKPSLMESNGSTKPGRKRMMSVRVEEEAKLLNARGLGAMGLSPLAKRKRKRTTKAEAKKMVQLMEQTRAKGDTQLDAVSAAVSPALKFAYRADFPLWRLLSAGGEFNLCLYGLGSKAEILTEYATWLAEAEVAERGAGNNTPTVVFNGHTQRARVAQLLQYILEDVYGVYDKVRVSQGVGLIRKAMKGAHKKGDKRARLRLVVYGIDGVVFGSIAAQRILSDLASLPGISMITTLDHLSGPTLWSSDMAIKYNLVFVHTPTYGGYTGEMVLGRAGEDGAAGSGGGDRVTLAGALQVLRTVTPNSRGIFELLLRAQLDAEAARDKAEAKEAMEDRYGDDGPSNSVVSSARAKAQARARAAHVLGLSWSDLHTQAQNEFLTSDDASFRAQLVEFFDHKLLARSSHDRLGEILSIPLPRSMLKSLLTVFDDPEGLQ